MQFISFRDHYLYFHEVSVLFSQREDTISPQSHSNSIFPSNNSQSELPRGLVCMAPNISLCLTRTISQSSMFSNSFTSERAYFVCFTMNFWKIFFYVSSLDYNMCYANSNNKTTLIEEFCHHSSMGWKVKNIFCLRHREVSLPVKTDWQAQLSLYFLQMRENWWLGFQLTT